MNNAHKGARLTVYSREQIVARARANGTKVWYLRAENEGHGFARKENADFRFYAMVRFLETTLHCSIRSDAVLAMKNTVVKGNRQDYTARPLHRVSSL